MGGSYNAVHWILGYDMYYNSMKKSFRGQFINSFIERGRIIEYDVFGNIGTEQDKVRPAIVLLVNGNNGAIIAPIGKSAYNSGRHYHVSLEQNLANQGNMKNNCGIRLEQIRYIDKNRIVGRYGKVSDAKKLDEIDGKLTRNLSTRFYNKFHTLVEKNKSLDEELTELNDRLQEKEHEIALLNEKIQSLEQEKVN